MKIDDFQESYNFFQQFKAWAGTGVLFENGAQGTFRNNTVLGNAGSGIEVRDFSF